MKQQLTSLNLAQVFAETSVETSKGITFIKSGESEYFVSYAELYNQALTFLGFLETRFNITRESEIVIHEEDNHKFLVCFWACIIGGIIPVPIAVGGKDEHKLKLFRIYKDLNNPYLFTDTKNKERLHEFGIESGMTSQSELLESNFVDSSKVFSPCKPATPIEIDPQDTAFVQYSSGSTGAPKGVMLSHKNLVYNIHDIAEKGKLVVEDNFLSWIPLTHDLGMIACHLSCTLTRCNQFIMPTSLFIRRPLLWMEKSDEHRITRLCSPNFGYQYFLQSYKRHQTQHDWDLSPIKSIYNGAEPISAQLCREFTQELSIYGMTKDCITPCYGLAEASVGVTIEATEEPLKEYFLLRDSLQIGDKATFVTEYKEDITLSLVGAGKPFKHCEVRIVGSDTTVLEANAVGHIEIRGENVTTGYYNNPEATKKAFTPDGWLKTGDLGLLLDDGSIVITGRYKNMIILHGQNYYAHDVEGILFDTPEISLGKVAACGIPGTSKSKEELILFVLYKKKTSQFLEVVKAINKKLAAVLDILPDTIVPVREIPKTTSGKVQHNVLLKRYTEGLYDETLKDLNAAMVAEKEEALVAEKEFTALEKSLADVWKKVLSVNVVQRDDSFFELGGHSLLATKLVSAIESELNRKLSIKDIFICPVFSDMVKFLSSSDASERLGIEPLNIPDGTKIPLSFAQERLWFIDQFQGSVQYNVPTLLKINGPVKRDVLEHAITELISRHKALRTVIRKEDGNAYQWVQSADWAMEYAEVSDAKQAEKLIQKTIKAPFDLSQDFMLRALLLKFGETSYTLVLTVHHIAIDGWSAYLLLDELKQLYEAKLTQRVPMLPALSIDYSDYSVWQQETIQGDYLSKELNYWTEQLSGVPNLELPLDRQRPAQQKFNGNRKTFSVTIELREQLAAISQNEGVTLFMTLLAAFKVLLYKYTNEKDICVGSPIAGRQYEELEPLVGFFANTLALRTHLNTSVPFTSLLEQIKEVTLDAYLHQDVPFEKIVDALGVEREMNRTPVFQVMFSMESVPDLSELKLGDLILTQMPVEQNTTQFDWNFYMEDNEDRGLQFHIEYDTDLFNDDTIDRLGAHFIYLLKTVALHPDQTISKLSLFSEATQQQQIQAFNDNRVNFPFELTTDQRIDAIAQQYPNAIAVSDSTESRTYASLAENAGKQASLFTQTLSIEEEAIIGVLSDRSVAMIESIYGIWKAGAAYLPLHPELPANRLEMILKDAEVKTLVFTKKYSEIAHTLLEQLPSLQNLVCIDGDLNSPSAKPEEKRIYGVSDIQRQKALKNSSSKIDNLAYVIYTSGSTGKPKGALLEHRGMLNHLFIMIQDLHMDETSNVSQNASQSFDISVWQMFSALLVGGKTVVYSHLETLKVDAFIEQLNEDQISLFQVVPSYLSVLLDEIKGNEKGILSSLKYLLVTGETVKKNLLNRWFQNFPNVKVVNAYGPTEAADDITLHIMDTTPTTATVPIGKSLANLNIYVVNEDEQICPVGVKGELWVSGPGVGRGYINDPEKTKASFVWDPFSKEEPRRLYKTGDIGRYVSNGTLEFFGRKDYQVKVRGYRIELEEIEQYLSQLTPVKEAIVVVAEAEGQLAQIYGYVTCFHEEVDSEKLRQELAVLLPDYMVPSKIHILECFPLTPNGKIDRDQLATIQNEAPTEVEDNVDQSLSRVSETLMEIWKDLLEVDEVGINQNFFELGGHSLKVVSMISQIHKQLEVEISIKDVFVFPTIQSLSTLIEGASEVSFEAIPIAEAASHYPVSNAQRRLWVLDRFVEDVSAYNSYNAYHLKGNVNIEAFKAAILSIVDRHEVLRTVFIEKEGEPMQLINGLDEGISYCEIIDYSNPENTYERLIEELKVVANTPFDLSKGPLFTSRLYILGEDSYMFFCSMHHIICDGWSNNILVKEILENYKAFEKQEISKLPELTLQYKDYSVWQLEQFALDSFNEHKNYWHNKLSGSLPVLNFPSYTSRPPIQTFSGKTIKHCFNKATLDGLKALGAREEASLFMLLTTLLNVLFYKHTGQNDIIIGTVTAGRTHPDLENQLGYYLNTLALRNNVDPSYSFVQLLKTIKDDTLEAFNHQDYPFDQLVNELDFERDISRNAIFDVMVLLQSFDEDEDGLLIDGLQDIDIAPVSIENDGSPFDMDFDFTEERDELKLTLTYNDLIFTQEQMENMILHLESLTASVLSKPKEKIGTISIISEAEKALLMGINKTEKELPLEVSYHHYLEQFALETPDKTAVIFRDHEMSYKGLNDQANKMARAILKQLPLKEDNLVAVFLDRSDIMMATILGIWKTGAAYIPIEKKVPDNRVVSLVADAGVVSVIADKKLMSEELAEKLSGICKLIFIQDLLEWSETEETDNLDIHINPNSLSFTIFTSGSTGKPKGAMNEHIGMMNHALATVDYLKMDQNSVLVQNASQSFDISVWQLFTALVTGGTTAIYGDEIVNAPDQLLKNLIAHKATVFQVVPSYLSMLLEIIESERSAYPLHLKTLICCGEAIKPKSIAQWLTLYPGTQFVNDYGPAEASDGTTWHVFDSVDENAVTIPIGTPIYNMANYIVDDTMNLCPVGVIGEICVAGIGVGRGYINDPERTAKVFTTDPFSPDKKQRLYKTGDLGRVLPNGWIEFHGRKDYQIKVNGQRIELGEIEAKLIQMNLVKDVAVIDDVNPTNGRKYLFAFVVNKPHTEMDALQLQHELAKELPPFMIPSGFEALEALPLTPNGKVDRNYLRRLIKKEESERQEYVAPETDMEHMLVSAWESVLKKENIGILDNFYESGGDSIGAIQVSSYLYKNELQVEVKDIMRFATIKELAPLVKPLNRIADQGIITGSVDLTPIQAGFFEMKKSVPNHYNQSILLKSKERIDKEVLLSSLAYIQHWHDALRITFKTTEVGVVQHMNDDILPITLLEYDQSAFPKAAEIDEKATQLQAGISLEDGPLMRSMLLKKPEADYILLAIHHLVIDAVSWRVIIEDLSTVYLQILNGDVPQLPAKTDSFKDWSQAIKSFVRSSKFRDEIDYWKTKCEIKASSIPYNPSESKELENLVKDQRSMTIQLDQDYVKRLDTEVHKAFNTEINDILLTALGMSVHRSFSLDLVPVMLESHGRASLRENMSTLRTVGWFTSEYPVHLDMNAIQDKATLIKVVKDLLHKVPNNGIGYGILKYLHPTYATEVTQFKVPQIAFNYLGNVDGEGDDGPFEMQDNRLGQEEALENNRDYPIEFLGLTKGGYMEFTVEYSNKQFKEETIHNWLIAFKESLEELIDFCSDRDFSEATPSDFDYSDLSLDDLVELNDLF